VDFTPFPSLQLRRKIHLPGSTERRRDHSRDCFRTKVWYERRDNSRFGARGCRDGRRSVTCELREIQGAARLGAAPVGFVVRRPLRHE